MSRLIAICGIDGSGKTTQQRLLASGLSGLGHEVVETRQPTDWYRELPWVRTYLDTGVKRCSPTALALLAAADRLIHCENIITPALASGKWVITDRYVFSSLALFKMRGVDQDFVRQINKYAPKPDRAFLLRVDPEVAHDRLIRRENGRVKYEERDVELLSKAQQMLVEAWPSEFSILDGTRPPDELAEIIMHEVQV